MASSNESPRRRFNDDRKRLFGTAGRLIAFVCECPDPTCRDTVLLTVADYEARAAQGLVVYPNHDPGAVVDTPPGDAPRAPL